MLNLGKLSKNMFKLEKYTNKTCLNLIKTTKNMLKNEKTYKNLSLGYLSAKTHLLIQSIRDIGFPKKEAHLYPSPLSSAIPSLI